MHRDDVEVMAGEEFALYEVVVAVDLNLDVGSCL